MRQIDKIKWQSRCSPLKVALSVPGPYRDTVSYARLQYFINNCCKRLVKLGVAPNLIYGLLIDDVLLHIVMMLALEELGAASVSLESPQLPEGLTVAALLADHGVPAEPCPALPVDLGWIDGDGICTAVGYEAKDRPENPCRIILTSGTTGRKKCVALTHRMVAERVASYDFVFGSDFPEHTRMLCCMGLASSLGYLFCIYMLARGGMFCIPDASIDSTARKISHYGIQTMVASSLTLAEIWAASQTGLLGLHSLQLVLTAGSPLPRALADRVRDLVCSRILNIYGSTEAGVVATAPVEMLDLSKGQAGFVVPGMHVEIVGRDQGVGRIRIRSTANAREYIGGEREGASSFEGDWFYPGDIGSLGADGLLSVLGRENNLINIGGYKTTLEAIEAEMSSAPGVSDMAAMAIPDGLGVSRVAVAIVPKNTWSEKAFWAYAHGILTPAFRPIRILPTKAIPRSQNGKIDRRALADLFTGHRR